VDFQIKPDVVAPGVNVLSSIPLAYCGGASCWAFFQGTSMATPHLAGSAAVLRSFYPDWSSAIIRSAIVNTANRHVLKDWVVGAPLTDVDVVGSGREDLLAAVNASVALDPVSVSFGGVPTGSGQTQPFSVTLTSLRGVAVTYSLAILGGDLEVSYSVSPSSITLQPGASGTVNVIMSAVKGAALGPHEGMLTLSSGGTEVAHAGIQTWIK
jgi:subtilisin family serine protease